MASENDRHEAYKNYIAANESTVLKGLKNWLLFGQRSYMQQFIMHVSNPLKS